MQHLVEPVQSRNIDLVRFARRHRLPIALAALIAELCGIGGAR